MSRKSTARKPSGAELRAIRDQRQMGGPYEQQEASRRESSFLRNITSAGDDLEWILFNRAWTQLGFERVGDWWEKRVLPVLVKLDLRPSQRLADAVIAAIEADEAELPKTQRRRQREIATLARTSQSTVSRSLTAAGKSEDDLDPSTSAVSGDAADPAEPRVGTPGDSAGDGDTSPVAVPTQTEERTENEDTPTGEEAPTGGQSGPDVRGFGPDGATPPVVPGVAAQPPVASGVVPAGDESPGSASRALPGDDPTDSGASPMLVADAPDSPDAGEPLGGVRDSAEGTGDTTDDVLAEVEGLAEWMDRLDVDVLGPLFLGEELARIDAAVDTISRVAGLLRRWHGS